jgi:adenylate cyclase
MVELRIDDLRMYNYPARQPLGSVAIVAIDDSSIRTIGRWPWPRGRIAELVSKLHEYGAKTVGLDLVLSEPDTTSKDCSSSTVSKTEEDVPSSGNCPSRFG